MSFSPRPEARPLCEAGTLWADRDFSACSRTYRHKVTPAQKVLELLPLPGWFAAAGYHSGSTGAGKLPDISPALTGFGASGTSYLPVLGLSYFPLLADQSPTTFYCPIPWKAPLAERRLSLPQNPLWLPTGKPVPSLGHHTSSRKGWFLLPSLHSTTNQECS